MPILLPSAKADAMLAESAARQRLADAKTKEWPQAFAAWQEAYAARIAAERA
jgi:hypothetical protein